MTLDMEDGVRWLGREAWSEVREGGRDGVRLGREGWVRLGREGWSEVRYGRWSEVRGDGVVLQ